MMSIIKTGLCATLLLVGAVVNADTVDAEKFVEDVSQANIAQIEMNKIALEQSDSADIKAYARKMIDDHANSNRELRVLAKKRNLKMEDEATLESKAKELILQQRDGESFDDAFINHQIKIHKKAIDFYGAAARADDSSVRSFAVAALPKRKRHLRMIKGISKEFKLKMEKASKK